MKILSIETSCDDTCISILEVKGGIQNASFKILANKTISQINIHIPYGGVFPALAKREHIKNLPIIFEACMKQAKLDPTPSPLLAKKGSLNKKKIVKPPFDLIAATSGPGLEPCLWTGIVFAKELAIKYKIPLVPVNHMEGHVLSVFGKDKGKFKIIKPKTPTLSLLVSGGHTELVLSKKWMRYERVGETVDDAVGEAFDKVARMLGLPYPGGPEISRLAEGQRQHFKESENFPGPRFSGSLPQPDHEKSSDSSHSKISLPRPMLHSKDFNFSYSGLKTSVLYLIRDLGGLEKISEETKAQIALEFENAAIECLVYKTKKAIKKYEIKTLIVAGGVSANEHLRNEMKIMTKNEKVKLLFPPKVLSMDNSLMIAIAGYLNFVKNKKKVPKTDTIKADGNLRLK